MMMQRMKQWMTAAFLVCCATMFTACTSNEDNAGTKDADHAINADGTPNTAHSVNPVPFIYVTENKNATVRSGVLADVAPSILHIMRQQQPKEMTGHCLISE